MDMDKLVSLCKRRGFLFQSSEIYGGLNGFWDYGPLGVELKRNIKEAWWRDMVTGHDDLVTPPGRREAYEMVGLDCTIIMHPQVWKCSGHYDLFHRLHGRLPESKKRYRYDQVRGRWVEVKGQRSCHDARSTSEDIAAGEVLQPASQDASDRWQATHFAGEDRSTRAGARADAKDGRSPRREFNLMFKTMSALGEKSASRPRRPGHLRQLQERARQHARASAVRHRPDGQELSQRDHAAELHVPLARVRADGDRVLLPSQTSRRSGTSIWRDRRMKWYTDLGLAGERLRLREHEQGRAEPLLVRHGRHRVRVSVPAAGRVRRAGRHRPSRRLRPAQPHGRQARRRTTGRCNVELGRRRQAEIARAAART